MNTSRTDISKPRSRTGLAAAASVLFSLAVAQGGHAETAAANFTINQIVIDQVLFSGCMARLAPGPQTVISGCANGFVTFDCKGELGGTRSDGATKLSAAQLAFVTDTKAFIRIDNTKKANGYCLAVRVDNTKLPAGGS